MNAAWYIKAIQPPTPTSICPPLEILDAKYLAQSMLQSRVSNAADRSHSCTPEILSPSVCVPFGCPPWLSWLIFLVWSLAGFWGADYCFPKTLTFGYRQPKYRSRLFCNLKNKLNWIASLRTFKIDLKLLERGQKVTSTRFCLHLLQVKKMSCLIVCIFHPRCNLQSQSCFYNDTTIRAFCPYHLTHRS